MSRVLHHWVEIQLFEDFHILSKSDADAQHKFNRSIFVGCSWRVSPTASFFLSRSARYFVYQWYVGCATSLPGNRQLALHSMALASSCFPYTNFLLSLQPKPPLRSIIQHKINPLITSFSSPYKLVFKPTKKLVKQNDIKVFIPCKFLNLNATI